MAPVKTLSLCLLVWLATYTPWSPEVHSATLDSGPELKTLDTPREFPAIQSSGQWKARAKEIHDQILVSCGLWPLPNRTPLHAHIFGRLQRDGYSVEKVYLETSPGFYLAGNLYRPQGRGTGPFPAVLNPHGHWEQGRLADTQDGSIPARCISFARQGMIAFSYDMVGYNDTHFAGAPTGASNSALHHSFATNHTDLLWNISLMGLQTWNSIRALDFLESLPDADRHRLACTGESGGGTQTFMLGAVDDRLAAQAPVVMVSHIMQGGCLCENAPELRVDFSNMEIAAVPAARPQILVAATGDWTKDTPKVEGPAIAHIYRLLGAPQKFRYVQFDFGHNYNQTSREAVYAWFEQWLLNQPPADSVKEAPYHKEADADLRVFPDSQLPPGALTQEQFIQRLRERHQAQWQALVPHDKTSLKRFESVMRPAWRHTLQLGDLSPAPERWQVREPMRTTEAAAFTGARLSLQCAGDSEAVLATYWTPKHERPNASSKLVVLCTSEPRAEAEPGPLGLALLNRGLAVLAIERFSVNRAADQFTNFYSTYNRTLVQERVRDLIAICAAAPNLESGRHRAVRVILAGSGPAAVWALLAAPAAQGVIADLGQLNLAQEESWLAPELFCPGVLNLGGVAGPAMLAAPHPLWVCNTGSGLEAADLSAVYASAGRPNQLRIESGPASKDALADWVAAVTTQ